MRDDIINDPLIILKRTRSEGERTRREGSGQVLRQPPSERPSGMRRALAQAKQLSWV